MFDFIIKYWLEVLFSTILFILTTSVKHLYAHLKKEQLERDKRLQKEREEQELIKEGVLTILHDRVYQACMYYLSKNEISPDDLKNLEYLYEGYHSLGGNATCTELYNRCKNLPLKIDNID